MKNVNISEDDYNFLLELKNNLLTQDERFTRDPFYIIKDVEKIYGLDSDYSSDYSWISEDGDTELDPNNIEEIENYFNGDDEDDEGGFDIELFRDKSDNSFGEYGCDNYEDYFMDKHGFRKIYYIENYITTEQGAYFLTEQNAIKHLEQNKHRYSDKACVYADSTWRNSEMNKLREIILNI